MAGGHPPPHPHTPAHLSAPDATLAAARVSRAHHTGRTPCRTPGSSCPRYAPLRMSREKSLDGCNVVARIDENATVVTHTPMPCRGHRRHVAARHSPRLMLHYTARLRKGLACSIVSPCMHGHAVKVLALVFSPTRRLLLMPSAGIIGVFAYTATDAYALGGHPWDFRLLGDRKLYTHGWQTTANGSVTVSRFC